MPRAAEERSQFEAPVQARSQVEPEIGAARAADVWGAARSENVNSAAAGSETACAPDATVREVMDWIAQPAEAEMMQERKPTPIEIGVAATPTKAILQDDRSLPVSEPSSAISFYQTVEHAGSPPLPAANSAETPWSVHIGAIHLEIEAPRPAPSPRAPAPQPVAAALSAPHGSRLRRYYL
jgi:hypothetical protein